MTQLNGYGQSVVTPDGIDPRSGGIVRLRNRFMGEVRTVHLNESEFLRPGDLLIPQLGLSPVICISQLEAGFAFASTFEAIRLRPGPIDMVWLWAALNSSRGIAARRGLQARSGTVDRFPGGVLADMLVPLAPNDWPSKDIAVSLLFFAATFNENVPPPQLGQSWWRTLRLPGAARWDIAIATPSPELLTEGTPLEDIVESTWVGRQLSSNDFERPGSVPYLTSRDLRQYGTARKWTREKGVAGDRGDLVVADVGSKGPAAILTGRTMVGNGIIVARFHDPSLADAICDFLNGAQGQASRAILVTGSQIPHLGRKGLMAFHLPDHVFACEANERAARDADLSVKIDRILWS